MVLKQSLTPAQINDASDLLKALANPQRLSIVCALMSGEKAVHELERDLGIRQPNLSQHLSALRESDTVEPRRNGRSVLYSLANDQAARVVDTLQAIFAMPGAKPATAKARRVAPVDVPGASARGDAAVFARIVD